jgi:ribose transport system substrate-binding protein
MKSTGLLRRCLGIGAIFGAALTVSATAHAAGPEIVSGPSGDPNCYAPWASDTKFFKYPAKSGPFRIALSNSYIANAWRIQMIKTAKAYAAQPEVAKLIKEFKVVSTGEDLAAQISAVNNFIDSGYDAIVINSINPDAFGAAIKRAKDAGIVVVSFDGILNSTDTINVNVDQKGLGVDWAKWMIEKLPNGGKILEVRGVAGVSVDTDRHNGIHETLDASGKKWDVVEVVGKWDSGVAQKASADAIAVQGPFDGVIAQGGDTGVVQAMMDAKHKFVPFAGETENGFLKLCAEHSKDGLSCWAAGSGPGQVAVAIKTALAALQGQVIPQQTKLPLAPAVDPNIKDGVDYYSDQPSEFYPNNSFPTCGINFDAREIINQTQDNQ